MTNKKLMTKSCADMVASITAQSKMALLEMEKPISSDEEWMEIYNMYYNQAMSYIEIIEE